MTVDLLYTGLLPHQTALYAARRLLCGLRCCAPRLCRRARCGTSPAHRPAWAHSQLLTAGNATAKAQLGQSPVERSDIARGDEEVFLVHRFGLERPSAVPLKPELLLHHKSILHQLVRDNTANLFAGLALFTVGGVGHRYQRTRPCWLLVVAPLKAPGSCSWRRIVCSISRPLNLHPRRTRMQGR